MNVYVGIPQEVIAEYFLKHGSTTMFFRWMRDPEDSRSWWTVEITEGARESLHFIAKRNGVEMFRSELPISALFDWLPRMVKMMEEKDGKGGAHE